MSAAKNFMVQHSTKGQVKLGSLSHNELCRAVVNLMMENTGLYNRLMEANEKLGDKDDKVS